MPEIGRGDWVYTRVEGSRLRPGMVTRVAKSGEWADVDWGGWSKRMKVSSLVKPKEVYAPGLSGSGNTAWLVQTDGEDWPTPSAEKGD